MAREMAGPDMAVIVAGKPRGMGKPSPRGPAPMGEDDMSAPGDDESQLPPGFEAAAREAFPDMDPSAYAALERLIDICVAEKE